MCVIPASMAEESTHTIHAGAGSGPIWTVVDRKVTVVSGHAWRPTSAITKTVRLVAFCNFLQ